MSDPKPFTVAGLMELVSEYGQCRWSEGSSGATYLDPLGERRSREEAADLYKQIEEYAAKLATPSPVVSDERLDECAQQAGLWRISIPIPDEWRTRLRDFLSACAPTPSNGSSMDATTDECIELAGALEQRRALMIVEDVAHLATTYAEDAFRAGLETACEEITHRLRTEVWEGCLPPIDAQTGAPATPLTLRDFADSVVKASRKQFAASPPPGIGVSAGVADHPMTTTPVVDHKPASVIHNAAAGPGMEGQKQ